MNLASFRISVEESIKFLRTHNLFKSKGLKEMGNHSDEFKKVCKKNRHTDIFNVAIKNKDYEILLFDDSFFQFAFNNGVLRYSFIQNPNLFVSKDDYLNSLYTPEDLISLSEDEYEDLTGSIMEEDYEQFFNEQDINLTSHIIRYDLDVNGYSPLIHSYSHIHIGLNENLRIPCSKELTPLKFVIFAIKNTYYDQWKNIFTKNENFSDVINESKKKCSDLPEAFWNPMEKFELFLH